VVMMAVEDQFDGMRLSVTDDLISGSKMPFAVVEDAVAAVQFACGVLFVIEAALKIVAMRHRYFMEAMNWLDFLLVLSWVLELAGIGVGSKAKFTRLLRLLKLVRLLKLLRIFRAWTPFSS